MSKPEGKTAKKGMSKETLDRLTKPVVSKKPTDMDKDCTFQPKLCEKSLELTAGREKFHTRVETDLANYRKAMDARVNAKPGHTFKPNVNIPEEYVAKIEKKGDFEKRIMDDIETRKKKKAALEEQAIAGFTFQPTITQSPKNVKVEGKFLERVTKDLEARKNRDTAEKKDPECKFQPEISKNSTKIMKSKGAPKFKSRMVEDLEKRREKQEEIKKELSKPPKFGKKKK
mmetsp:Transcript_25670/g.35730  ORF Transcript_25670/g.35730 Transcript_25670/m.35730 type:complete len:229 (+) Transcript_25670:36-722(+)|eukprot:CAMPEP_0184493338 /NCGR_PEP_ID=MMETSP0113_2-20130426/25725_1 /TAXON_ID=91329 /ORGANISM="Norrisiella sphaerica, Strain BC52" /LENGTH=228 /DNA_ID=CAMNT_0026878557 /DNA_START=654 /DNA_END=1340 /DNA_ORIENTATION=-